MLDGQIMRTRKMGEFIIVGASQINGQLDCGSWFSDQFSGETLPKLEQLLEEVSGKILLNLEIKSKAVESEERTDGVESQVCEMVHAFGLEEQVLVSSFHHPCLNRVRKHKYSLPVAPLLERPASFAELKNLNQTYDSFSIHTDEKHVDQQLLREMQESGIPLLCYTVNDPVRMKELSEGDSPESSVMIRVAQENNFIKKIGSLFRRIVEKRF